MYCLKCRAKHSERISIEIDYFFSSSIIRRLLTLINEEAKLAAQCEAYKKQAESATAAAKRLMEEKDNSDNQVRTQCHLSLSLSLPLLSFSLSRSVYLFPIMNLSCIHLLALNQNQVISTVFIVWQNLSWENLDSALHNYQKLRFWRKSLVCIMECDFHNFFLIV